MAIGNSLILFLLVLFSAESWAFGSRPPQVIETCGSLTFQRTAKYCIYQMEGSKSKNIIYVLHGRGQHERVWKEYADQINGFWKTMGYEIPTVISFTYGSDWLLVEENGSPLSGLLDEVVDRVMPALEEKIGGLKGERILVGGSMGGFNTTQLALKRGHLFSQAIILCPAMTTFSPFDPLSIVWEYIERTHAKPSKVFAAIELVQKFFPDDQAWLRASPVELAKKYLNSSSVPIYLSCGTHDEYGFFEGTEQFYQIGKDRGARIKWKPVPFGKHCDFSELDIAWYMINEI